MNIKVKFNFGTHNGVTISVTWLLTHGPLSKQAGTANKKTSETPVAGANVAINHRCIQTPDISQSVSVISTVVL